ncbi:MAG: PH domain-containing protein [Gammaproteobacteria bacterium]|nr:PH domain-containing protein [Gammaproteobacteria bacterium]MYC25870.1 PH domain-containing protein [Gammaproteobacteria bacterium]
MVAEQPIEPSRLQDEFDTLLSDYSTWRMASPFALLFFFGSRLAMVSKALFQQVTNFVPIVGVTSLAVINTELTWYQGILIVVALILIIVFIVAVLAYRRFRFRITNESIAVKSGILRITQTDVRWERVRAVNLERGPIERALGLAQISLDTAGSAAAEVQVPAIKLQLAELIRAKVSMETTVSDTIGDEVSNNGQQMYRMDLIPLVKASFCTQGTLAMMAAALGAFFWLGATLYNMLDPDENSDNEAFLHQAFNVAEQYYLTFADKIEQITSIPITQSWLGMTIPGILTVFMLITVLFLARALYFSVTNYDLQLLRRNNALSTVRGLFTKKRTNVKLERVQSVSLKMNVREIGLKLCRLTAKQSMSGKEHMLSLPSVPTSVRDEIVELAALEAGSQLRLDPKTQSFQPISIVYFWQMFIGLIIVPFLVVLITSLFSDFSWLQWVWLGFLCGWVPICATVSLVRWRKAGYVVDLYSMISKSGLLGYTLDMGKFKKVQRVRIEQSFIQRFTGKSTLTVSYATTNIVVPFLARARAIQLHDYISHVITVRNSEWH